MPEHIMRLCESNTSIANKQQIWKKLVQPGIIFTGGSKRSSPTKVLNTPNVSAAHCCLLQWYGLQDVGESFNG